MNSKARMSTFKTLTRVILLACALGMNVCSPQRPEQRQPNLDFSLTNLTGGPVKYVYLSPSTSSGWEENILTGSDLKSGDTLNIRFNPNETATMWDMRIEGANGQYAEWKNLKLVDISEIRLVFEPSPPNVVAELE